MRRLEAPAKINLALVVGPLRDDGKHEVVTLLQRVGLADVIELSPGAELAVSGFADDTIVAAALTALAAAANLEPNWIVHITKSIPVSAGLGGGSSDAATALRLANESLESPLDDERLAEIAAAVGADVPFFLRQGPQLGRGDGSRLTAVDLPQSFTVVLVLPDDEAKRSTAEVYAAFDARGGAEGFEERCAALGVALAAIREAEDLAALPTNDLATSQLADRLRDAGALRADVSGAGPCVYGLFADPGRARGAARELRSAGQTWVTTPR
jgi:4-diphosphocytidyl-2-C-methyl-D-erythritol kinase